MLWTVFAILLLLWLGWGFHVPGSLILDSGDRPGCIAG